MQFEEFDKKIKEAADHHHPAYDEQAWAKMHKLLDKHLPEKEKKRRRFIWLFFAGFMLAGTGIFMTVNSLISKEHKPITAAAISRPEKRTAPGNPVDVETKTSPVETSAAAAPHAAAAPQQGIADQAGFPEVKPTAGKISSQHQKKFQPAAEPVSTRAVQPANAGNVAVFANKQKKVAGKKNIPVQSISKPKSASNPDPSGDVTASANPSTVKQPGTVQAVTQYHSTGVVQASPADHADTVAVPAVVVPSASETESADRENKSVAALNKKSSAKKKSQFFLTVSAGPDASFTPSGKPGRIIPVTGAGIGYNYKGRVSLRAGFYNANKVYSASPEAYNPPPNFYNYYPYLQKVDASCRVYEIPVSLGYHFGIRPKQGWFVSASLSSYIMKRETYDYYYKTSAWGAVQHRVSNHRNKNEHFFTVLGFSGGYQRKITNRISLIAEPYLRIPATGVGYGKVKLNSTGILFSVAVQPAAFVPRKQKR